VIRRVTVFSELFDRARPRDPVRFHVAGKLSALDAERAVALRLDEVPGQLAVCNDSPSSVTTWIKEGGLRA